ncbi:hypothetical protein BC937DRAFT_91526 [Endogone sp. FLAS-F59071]|nr:hypothetical protein BC937DRAFT_91526 [Endogone sp. FLAS-F59071]|eukprot:RUS16184.1 hypothetical protein BC937DRAFT_91526 [Endogone sp. FLAS-F59071]
MGAIVAEPTSAISTPKKTLNRQASRTSLTPSNARCSKTPMPTTTTKDIWRPPGKANIRDVLENAFLPASPIAPPLELRKEDAQNSSGRPPWYPPSWYPGIPTPAPVQRAEQEFEKKIKKAVPKIPMLNSNADPKLKYIGFKEIGTGVNGSVVKASSRTNPNILVAIKRCKVDSDREYRAAILRELRIMSTGNVNLIQMREVALWRDEVNLTLTYNRGFWSARTRQIWRSSSAACWTRHKSLVAIEVDDDCLTCSLPFWEPSISVANAYAFPSAGCRCHAYCRLLGSTADAICPVVMAKAVSASHPSIFYLLSTPHLHRILIAT